MVTTRREREVVPLMPGRYSRKADKNSGEREFILVVEDDMRTLRLERFILEEEGYAVASVGSGEEALALASETPPALVLLDIGLPGIDGFVTCQKLREFSQVPIIMVTGRDCLEDKVKGLESGADDYVTKPFLTNELATRVKVLLRRNHSDNAANNAASEEPASPDSARNDSSESVPGDPQQDLPQEETSEQPEEMPVPAPSSNGHDRLYEGTVRLVVESTGNAKDVISFVSELRQNPQFRLLRLVASQYKEGMDIWLGLREPLPLQHILLQIQGVCEVASFLGNDAAEEEALCVSLVKN